MNQIDFIGDIHGYADRLEVLLKKMGYTPYKKGFRHPERKVFFVGDFIDRGPDSPGVINIVRSMMDNGDALAVCGNHEHNAICFNTLTDSGYLRNHSLKNFNQHRQTLLQYLLNQDEYDSTIHWFKSLPLYYESENFRVVHATWDTASINYLENHTSEGILSDEQYIELQDKKSELFKAVETVCKGKEARLPDGISFTDKDGARRFEIRTKWWEDPMGKTLKEMSIIEDLEFGELLFKPQIQEFYYPKEKPVFFGHYWLKGTPKLFRHNVCCLDYSVAKGGVLVAYRFNGEQKLDDKNLIWI